MDKVPKGRYTIAKGETLGIEKQSMVKTRLAHNRKVPKGRHTIAKGKALGLEQEKKI